MDFAAARLNMIECQLRPNKLLDPAVIAAFQAVPREAFVPEGLRQAAYVDEDIALGSGRYVMEPMVLARLLQAAEIGPEDRALVVGCATGYAAALLARIAAGVIALESDAGLAGKAESLLAVHGGGKARVVRGALAQGYAAGAPFDVIMIDGAVSAIPDALKAQLAPGGRLVAVVTANERAMGQAVRGVRLATGYAERALFDAGTPVLPEFRSAPSFVF
ncbi:MAG: protein-L-isoaspartate O-methyltransferase [Alphaproteobacteria bacterium]|nr:protein-L-isoaspartate O-methyltransferase [Alphaproteobacteria bacterium]